MQGGGHCPLPCIPSSTRKMPATTPPPPGPGPCLSVRAPLPLYSYLPLCLCPVPHGHDLYDLYACIDACVFRAASLTGRFTPQSTEVTSASGCWLGIEKPRGTVAACRSAAECVASLHRQQVPRAPGTTRPVEASKRVAPNSWPPGFWRI